MNSLVRVTTETAGLNCTAGGSKIETGLDLDADGVLDAGEVLQTQYVCHGIAGVDGGDGTDGANGLNSLVRVTAEPAGANCSVGGTKIETGLDADVDGVLDPLEIAQTRYVCNGVNGADGSDGVDGAAGFNSLVKVSVVAAGVPCTTGGQKVETGLDLDRDNALDVAEVTQTQYVCHGLNGVDGGDGSNGLNSLVRVTTEPAGAHCANGGSFVETGIDLNTNGILDLGEVTQSQYVCNGVDGTDGLDGSDGLAGINSLVRITVEPVGLNCAAGGSKVESGLDTDADNILDAGEVTQTQFVCNGAAGADGTDGSDGSNGSNGLNSLVRITPEAIGANCAAAGNLIESGLDLNSNGILDVGEVTSTRYVCNGSDGGGAGETLIILSNAAIGGVCVFGGVKLESGVDLNHDAVLDPAEITKTQYVCNRQRTGFATIKAGYNNTCGVKLDGSLWCWGQHPYWRHDPMLMDGFHTGTSDVVIGNMYACVLKIDGTVWCWGSNSVGQLGNGTLVDSTIPVTVTGLSSVVQISGNTSHTCVTKNDGSAWCWGNNGFGKLGDGTTSNRSTPVQVSGMTSGVAEIMAGQLHSCLRRTSGAAFCWGRNINGMVGDGTTVDRFLPTAVSGMSSGCKSISAGGYQSCAVKTDGSAWCWGTNSFGELGSAGGNKSVPTAVSGFGSNTDKISAGMDKTCAIKIDGSAWCWGRNTYGELGNGTTTSSYVPTLVSGMATGVGQIKPSMAWHTCLIKIDGLVWCFGYNGYRELGDGTTVSSNVPVSIIPTGDLEM